MPKLNNGYGPCEPNANIAKDIGLSVRGDYMTGPQCSHSRTTVTYVFNWDTL